jgi:hypothetical protein
VKIDDFQGRSEEHNEGGLEPPRGPFLLPS